MHLQFSGWCGGVDPLGEGDERDPQALEIVEQGNQVADVPAESIQPPADEHVEASAPSVAE